MPRLYPLPFILLFILLFALLAVPALADEVVLEPDAVSKDYEGELPRSQPTEPTDTRKHFAIVDGFDIELAASEPLIADPVAMAFDEFGRLFVVCMRGYSEHREDHLGSIRMLEDTDGDGVFDRESNYASGLSWPTAIACYDGGVFVGAAPDVWYCKDTDGDGRADVQQRVLTGFGHQNVQGMLNSFRWGLDNRLYGAAGTNGGQIENLANEQAQVNLRGRDFSMDPATRSLRPESGGAQHGATFDRWGNRFVCSNSDHLQWIEFEDHHLQRALAVLGYRSRRSIATDGPSAEVYRTSDVEPWRIVRTRLRVKGLVQGPVEGGGRAAGYFTSASGVTAYIGDAFPEPFTTDDMIFVGDVGSNLVHLKRVETKGLDKQASRATADKTEFLTSTDNWFRPVQFANGPDGCLYVIDMYRETIEHPLSLPPMIKKHLDLNSGRDRGRIYRIRPVNGERPSRTLPGNASDEQLVAMLSHPNGWHRETAARLIVQRGRAGGQQREALVKQLESQLGSPSPHGRIQALYCLQSLERLTEDVLRDQLADTHPQVRIHALKVLESRNVCGERILAQLQNMVSDDEETVRYQLALTLSIVSPDHRIGLLAAMAQTATNPKLRFALQSSAGQQALTLLRALLAEKSASVHSRELTRNILATIGQQHTDIGPAVALLEGTADPDQELLAALLCATGVRGERLVSLLEDHAISDAAARVQHVVNTARTQAVNTELPTARRRQAMDNLALGSFGQTQTALTELLSPQQPASLRDAAVDAFGNYTDLAAADILLNNLSAFAPVGRRRALELLTSRTDWVHRLLEAVSAGDVSTDQVTTSYRAPLLRHRDPTIAERALEVFGKQSDRASVVEQLTPLLSTKGNSAQGKMTFEKVCASCHHLERMGVNVGPDLQPLRNRGAQFLLVNILDPNREVDARYEAYTVLTADGKTYSGILISDTATRVELLQADGKPIAVDKAEIEAFQATGRSLMPEGLEQELKPQGIADVIAFLIQSEY